VIGIVVDTVVMDLVTVGLMIVVEVVSGENITLALNSGPSPHLLMAETVIP